MAEASSATPPHVVTVRSVLELNAALFAATAGQIIELAPGTYTGLVIQNLSFGSSGVTITSADPGNPAVLRGLKVYDDTGLSFSNLTLSGEGVSDSYAFRVKDSARIAFTGVDFQGTLNENGLFVTGSKDITISGSRFHKLANAITDTDNLRVTISGNSFYDIRSDGIDNAGSSNVLIDSNTFTSFHSSSSAQHPDAIQFWTTNTTASAKNITITNNVFTRGDGTPVQGIFLRDQTRHLPYQYVVISRNTILGALYNGIYVTGADHVTLVKNFVAGYADQKSWIRLDATRDATLLDNSATAYEFTVHGRPPNVGMRTSGNMTIPAFPVSSGTSLQHDMVAAVGKDFWRVSQLTSPLFSLGR